MGLLDLARVALLAAGLGTLCAAQAQDSGTPGGISAPTGPMDVRADRAEYQRDGTSRLTGNVTLRSDTFSMDAAAMTLKQQGDGDFQGRLTGSPARLTHKPEQPGDPLMTAQASVMTYDTRTQIVELQGNARVTRGTDVITGNLIRYNVAARRVEAVGGSKGPDGSKTGQVRIILTPKKKGAGKAAAPAPREPDEPLTLGTDKVFDGPAAPVSTPAPTPTP